MKKCPQCQTNYFDNMLDFCLEDGAQLLFVEDADGQNKNDRKTIFAEPRRTESPTVAFSSNLPDDLTEVETIAVEQKKEAKPLQIKTEKLKTSAVKQWLNFLETAPVVVAVLHIYWQWLFLSKISYSGFFEYVFSSGFIFWLLLLVGGLSLSVVSIKYGKSKKFAVTALVVLAINVLLYIVPK